jgi:peptidoglycan hydrolase CwlO-like protein
MTLEEGLERLKERHEALAQSVELLGHHLREHVDQAAAQFRETQTQIRETQMQIRETQSLIRQNDVQIKANTENIGQLMAISARLVATAEAHTLRITGLEGRA